MIKIAIPTKGNIVDDHFGHCETYTIFTIDESNKIINSHNLPSPQGCGCKSNIASVLQELNVTVLLAGNMGNGALNVLNKHGMEVVRGCSGDTTQVVESYLQGKVNDSGLGCDHHHEEGHQCSH